MNARRQRGAPQRRDIFVRGAVCACSEAVVQQCRHSEAAVGSLETSGPLRELAPRNSPCAMLSQCECFCVACSCVRAFLQPLHVSARATGGRNALLRVDCNSGAAAGVTPSLSPCPARATQARPACRQPWHAQHASAQWRRRSNSCRPHSACRPVCVSE